MRYLNEQEEQRFNQILQNFSNEESAEAINIRMGRTIVYRGVSGKTPEIDRITSKQLDNLEKAVNNPEKSTGSITISKEQAYQIQNGQQAVNTLQPQQKTSPPQSASQLENLQVKLAELREQSERQRAEIAQLREVMLRQTELLQKLNTPVKEKLGNWFEQFKENATNRIQDFTNKLNEQATLLKEQVTNRVQSFNNSVREGLESTQQKIQDVGDRVTGRTELRQEVKRLQEKVQQLQEAQQLQVLETKSQQRPEMQRQEHSTKSLENQAVQKQVKPEEHSSQIEQFFQEQARQQLQQELAKLNQPERANFDRLVSEKERQYLVEFRAKELKEESEKYQLSGSNAKLGEQSDNKQSTLVREYLDFKKEEAEIEAIRKQSDYSHNDPYVLRYTKRASDEMQIQLGIIPPRSITVTGAEIHAKYVYELRMAQAEEIAEVREKRLKNAGVAIDPEKLQAIRKEAFNKVEAEWKQEKAAELKAWQESRGLESFQKFTAQQPQYQYKVNLADLEQWRKEAQALGRSDKHLEKIDQIVNAVREKTRNNPAATVEIGERDFKAMQRDRSEFKSKQQKQSQSEQVEASNSMQTYRRR